MLLNEMERPVKSQLVSLLRENFGFEIPELTRPLACKMLGRTVARLNEFRTSEKYFISEQNSSYAAMLATAKYLTEWLNEASDNIPSDVYSALLNLGYKKQEAQQAVSGALHAHPNPTDFDSFFRAAQGQRGKDAPAPKVTPKTSATKVAAPKYTPRKGGVRNAASKVKTSQPPKGSSATPQSVGGGNPPPVPTNKRKASDVLKHGAKHLGPHRVIPHVAGSAVGAIYTGLKGQSLSPEHGKIETGQFGSKEPGAFKQGLRGQALGPAVDDHKEREREERPKPAPKNPKAIHKMLTDTTRKKFGKYRPDQQREIMHFLGGIYQNGLQHTHLEEKDIADMIRNEPVLSNLHSTVRTELAKELYNELYALGYHA